MSLTGVKELDSILTSMPSTLTKKVLQRAAKIAAKPMVADMKSRAPKRTGKLRKSIGVKLLKSKQDNLRAVVLVGVRRGRKFKSHHAHLVEFGTKARVAKNPSGVLSFWSKGKLVKIAKTAGSPAKPFIRPSIDANIDQLRDSYTEHVAKVLHRFMKSKIKKFG